MAAEDLPTTTATPPADDDNVEEDLFGAEDDEATPKPTTAATPDVGGAEADNATAVAAAAEAAMEGIVVDPDAPPSTRQILEKNPPPAPLPAGWFLKPSHHSAPGNYYYFNQDTGECRWEYPSGAAVGGDGQAIASSSPAVSQESLNATAAAAAAAVKSILKRSNSGGGEGAAASPSPKKRVKTSSSSSEKDRKESSSSSRERKDHHHRRSNDAKEKHHHHHSSSSHRSSSSSGEPKEVRVLHILKKHRGSRRPASWRNPKITDSKEKAIADLRELISILEGVGGDAKELRATFEELAKTESDCSSAKRGGDLGFFGRRKMQPAFEKASFGLKVGQLSDVVDTSSGVHVILRLA